MTNYSFSLDEKVESSNLQTLSDDLTKDRSHGTVLGTVKTQQYRYGGRGLAVDVFSANLDYSLRIVPSFGGEL